MQIKLGLDKLVGLHQDQDTFTPSCPGSGLPRCDCSWWRRSPQSAEVLAHLGWGAQVGLAPDPQLAVAVGAPVVQDALVVAESKLPVVSLAVHLPPAEGGGDFPRRGLVGRGPGPSGEVIVVAATGHLAHIAAQEAVLVEGRVEALVHAPIAQLAVPVIAPAVPPTP